MQLGVRGKRQKPKPLAKLYVERHFTEDTAEWQNELQRHCEEVYTDMEETKEELENRIEYFWKNGNQQFSEERLNAEITVDMMLQARAKLSDNKVNGPEDAIVSEMIKKLPMEKICTKTKCFQEHFLGQMESPSSWKVVKLVFLRKLDAAPTEGIRSYWAIALTSVMSQWYASCVLLRLEMEEEPEKWKNLQIGGVEGVSCQHLQVMVTNLIQKRWEWQEERNPVIKTDDVDRNNDEAVQPEKTKRGDVGRVPHKNVYYGQEDMGADGLALSA